jgi:hypothetical protein
MHAAGVPGRSDSLVPLPAGGNRQQLIQFFHADYGSARLCWAVDGALVIACGRFGIRITLLQTRKIEPAVGMEAAVGKPHRSRRAFLPILAKAIAGMVLATAMPSRVAYAYGNCNDPNFYPCSNTACVPSGSDNACCPEGAQYLSHCDCLCYRSSADVNCGSYNYCH